MGTSLIEVLIALAIFSYANLGSTLLSLQGLKITRQAMHETQIILYTRTSLILGKAANEQVPRRAYFNI